MTVHSAAAISAAHTRQQIEQAVTVKALKLAHERQQSVVGLIESAAQLAQRVQAVEPGKGGRVDLQV